MEVTTWTYLFVGFSFALYIGIAIWSRASSTGEFYVAGGGVPAVANGMATGADWMSAASFISMAGIISFDGRDGGRYLMGWTGGYVLLALMLAPYLRRFGKFTVPDFIGDRYYSRTARLVAIVCAVFVSFTYVAGQMRGVGVVFARFLEVEVNTGVLIGMTIVFLYATLGGMKGITYTQVAQYCVMIFAFMVPAIFLSLMMTGIAIPQIGLGGEFHVNGAGQGISLLDKLDGLSTELGFAQYTAGHRPVVDVFFITMALMVGTAGLPHVIVRFYTVKRVSAARLSALWALIFIGILYTTAPAISAFARTNLLSTIPGVSYAEAPTWFKNWERSGLIAWVDKNGDGIIDYVGHQGSEVPAFKPMEPGKKFVPQFSKNEAGEDLLGAHGQRLLDNPTSEFDNELYIDRDIIVLANPEIGKLPNWVVGLIAAGGLAAALSTAAGLLLVISTSVAHDLVKKTLKPNISERGELLCARLAAGVAVLIAAYFGINPPGFVAEVVAFAFGLAAASFFPAIVLGIFTDWVNREGAVAGMICGLVFATCYIVYFKFLGGTAAGYWFGISPEGIGTVGMLLNGAIAITVSKFTPAPPQHIAELVQSVRLPRAANQDE